jgi:hypothetical protein
MSSPKAQSLAEQFSLANEAFMSFVEGLSDEELRRVCPNEQRTLAALARHVAGGILFELRSFKGIANGVPLPVVTKEQIDRLNAEHGEQFTNADREETLEMLRENGKTAVEWASGLSDEQLQRVGAYIDWVPEMTLEQWIERVLIGHIRMHQASMLAIVEPRPAATAD